MADDKERCGDDAVLRGSVIVTVAIAVTEIVVVIVVTVLAEQYLL